MRIAILDGEPDPASPFSAYLSSLAGHLASQGHSVNRFELRTLDLKGCSGCFNCWVKTPGECSKRDASADICRSAIASDLLLLAAPMVMGFTSALLKGAVEQMLPILHPYFVVEGGEVHHRARYAHYPRLGLLMGAGSDTDAEDIEIATTMWARMARDMKSRLVFAAVADRAAEEVADELALAA